MKLYLIVLVVFFGLFNKAGAQSPSAAIDSLVKFKVVISTQRPLLLKAVSKYHNQASYSTAILWELQNIMLQKTFHINPRKAVGSIWYSGKYPYKKSQDSANVILRVLLNKIKYAGLLTDRIYTHTLKDIDSGRYAIDMQMIGSLAELSLRLEWLTPARLFPVAEQLHKSGIVSDSSFARLQGDINNSKIESAFELNNYCRLNKTFDLKKYPNDPHLWIEQIHHDIASILPGLAFTNFNYITTPVPGSSKESMSEIKYKISLTCNGRIYKSAGTALEFEKKPGLLATDLLSKFFFRIFNKVLADLQSPYRLHNIMFSRGTSSDDNFEHLTIIALREEQAEIFMKEPCMSYMLMSMDDYDNTLTSGRIDSTIAGWKKMGLFTHLSEAEIAKGIDDAETDSRNSMNGLLSNFPHVVYALEPPIAGQHYPYAEILSHLAGITHGAFNPTNVSQKKLKGGIKLQYLFNGKVHAYTFHTAYGWLDTKFSLFIKGLAKENNLTGNFYPFPYENSVVYLTGEQYNYGVTNKWLDFRRRFDSGKETR